MLRSLEIEDQSRHGHSRTDNVYAGELEVRPPGAPTTEPNSGGSGVVPLWINTSRLGTNRDLTLAIPKARVCNRPCEFESLSATIDVVLADAIDSPRRRRCSAS